MAGKKIDDANVLFANAHRNMSNHRVVNDSLKFISEMSASFDAPSNRKILMECEVDKILVGSMNSHWNNINVQKNAFDAILKLGKDQHILMELLFKGVGECIIKSMTINKINKDIQYNGCILLSNISCCNADCKAALSKMGAIEAVIDSMQNNPDASNIQLAGCTFLSEITKLDDAAIKVKKINAEPIIALAVEKHMNVTNGTKTVKQLGDSVLKVLASVDVSVLKAEEVEIPLEQTVAHASTNGNEVAVIEKDVEIEISRLFHFNLIQPNEQANDLDKFEMEFMSLMRKATEILRNSFAIENTYVQYYNLKLLLHQYNEKRHKLFNQGLNLKSGLNFNQFKDETRLCKAKIDSIEAQLGKHMITADYQPTNNWKELAIERDQSRSRLFNLYNEYEEMRKTSSSLTNNGGNEDANELNMMENRLIELSNSVNLGMKQITILEQEKAYANSSSLLLNEFVQPEDYHKKLRTDDSSIDTTVISSGNNSILIESEEDAVWYRVARDKLNQDMKSQNAELKQKLSQMKANVKSFWDNALMHLNRVLENGIVLDPSIFKDIDISIQDRKEREIHLRNNLDMTASESFMNEIDFDRECEYHIRREVIQRVIIQIKDNSSKMKELNKQLFKIMSELHGDLTEQEQLKLEKEKEDVDAQLVLFKNENNSAIENITVLSQNMMNDNSQISDDSEDAIEEPAYDFPEIPLLAMQMMDLKKATTNKKISQSQQAVRQLLQKSGFLIERSLYDDYEFDNLPDEVNEIGESPEVKNSSVRICMLKHNGFGANITQHTLANTIKVLQVIDIEDFKTVRGAVVLASRTRHSSILPIETVFIDELTNKIFIQTPFRMGGSMKRWLSLKERSIGHKLDVLSKIADGLDAVHIHGIVHRDIKLENVVMDSNDDLANPSICDFDTSRDVVGALTMTTVGSKKIGTIRYMAPEIFERGEKATKESDVWSFVMMMLIALVYDGKYEHVPMKTIMKGIDRVDNDKSLSQAKQIIGKQYPTIMKLFEQVLGSNADMSQSRPKMSEIRDILLNADICECYLCKSEGIQPSYHRRLDGCECDGNDSNGNNKHFLCRHHFVRMIDAFAGEGHVYCMECDGNSRKEFNDKKILDVGGYELMKKVLEGREKELKRAIEVEIESRTNHLVSKISMEQLSLMRVKLEIENICIPRCPRCSVQFIHDTGCAAITCSSCKSGFCGYCLKDCGTDAHTHVETCPDKPKNIGFGGSAMTNMHHRRKAKRRLIAYWKSLPQSIKSTASKDPAIRMWLDTYQIVM